MFQKIENHTNNKDQHEIGESTKCLPKNYLIKPFIVKLYIKGGQKMVLMVCVSGKRLQSTNHKNNIG